MGSHSLRSGNLAPAFVPHRDLGLAVVLITAWLPLIFWFMEIDALEKMLARGQDSAMLRLTLGNAYIRRGEPESALRHLREAVRLDPDYSAAWKALGRLLAKSGCHEEALETYRRGLEVAERRGDMQVVRELKVFIRRLER